MPQAQQGFTISNTAQLIDGVVATADLADGAVTEAKQTLADNTTGNVSITKHGYAPKAPNDATKFLDGSGAFDTVKESDLVLTDITTNDVSTTKHGLVPKAPNDTSKFLRGDATWDSPSQAYATGAILIASLDTEYDTTTSLTYELAKEIRMARAGVVNVKFSLKKGINNISGRIYVNGGAIGTERTETTGSYVEYSEDITVALGDLVQLYVKNAACCDAKFYKNFRIYAAANEVATGVQDLNLA